MSTVFTQATIAVDLIRSKLPKELQTPRIGIICGSGLGGLFDALDQNPQRVIPYSEIPGFHVSTVKGHAGKLAFGFLGEKKSSVVMMVGRIHFYEGHSIQTVTFPIRVLKLLGINSLIITNAAGGLNLDYQVGDIVVINDHLNIPGLAGLHPLRGPNAPEFGGRFPALSDAYDLEYRRLVHQMYKKTQSFQSTRSVHEGVYAFVSGPTYETRAECRMLRNMGADVVGMSTVPEICVARHCGIRVLAMSLVTNCAILDPGPTGNSHSIDDVRLQNLNQILAVGKVNHLEVLNAGNDAATYMKTLVKQFVDDIHLIH